MVVLVRHTSIDRIHVFVAEGLGTNQKVVAATTVFF